MKWVLGKTGLWLWITVGTAAVAFATVQKLPDGDGKKILDSNCASCHGAESVAIKHLSKSDWEELIGRMKSYGAAVPDKDIPVLVDYLVKNFGNGPAPAAAPAASNTAG